ncbi:hypothetical protein [Nocardia sp. NPDC058497]
MAVTPGLGLALLCLALVAAAIMVYRLARLGSPAGVQRRVEQCCN